MATYNRGQVVTSTLIQAPHAAFVNTNNVLVLTAAASPTKTIINGSININSQVYLCIGTYQPGNPIVTNYTEIVNYIYVSSGGSDFTSKISNAPVVATNFRQGSIFISAQTSFRQHIDFVNFNLAPNHSIWFYTTTTGIMYPSLEITTITQS